LLGGKKGEKERGGEREVVTGRSDRPFLPLVGGGGGEKRKRGRVSVGDVYPFLLPQGGKREKRGGMIAYHTILPFPPGE